ncbi:MAG: amidohydrolase [Actinomyces sp.]|nr:MAG: amidohydrolase [Actinomyces sp.]
MAAVDFAAFDADNHYYEAEDAFIRHLDPAWRKRCMQWAEIDGRRRLLVAGRVNRFIPNPTFDPVARPGCLDDYFRGRVSVSDMREAFGELEPISPAYREREARLALMDEQGLEGCLLFPTLAVGMEAALEHDPPALLAAFDAFNRWLDDDWGFAHRDRIFTAGYLTLVDPDWCLDQIERMLGRGLRVVNIRPTSVVDGAGGRRSLGHRLHEPVWRRLEEAGVAVAMHSGDASYGHLVEHWGLPSEFEAFRYDPLRSLLTMSPISDAVASLIADGVLSAHPGLRIATIENGSEWVAPLVRKLEKTYAQHRHAFDEDPVEVLRRQVWVSPYYEDDLVGLAGVLGTERMIFGSDYPHAEGLADPVSFVDDLEGFDSAAIRRIMRDNARELVGLAA